MSHDASMCADAYLDGVLVGEEVDDLERVCNDADGEELLSVVAALHHQASRKGVRVCKVYSKYRQRNTPVNQSLNDGHLRLLELLLGITASGVGEVDGVTDLDVVGEGDVVHIDAVRTSIVSGCNSSKNNRGWRCTHSWVSHLPKSLTS